MSDESTVLGLIGTAVMGVVGWFVKGHHERIKGIEDTNVKQRDDLSRFELDAEKRFETKDSVQASLSRIHDRLDDHIEMTQGNFNSIQTDLKTIIGRLPK
ncbi:MAG: hypothetical protein AB7Q04_13315 [Steroidobacteraceae bacterium]